MMNFSKTILKMSGKHFQAFQKFTFIYFVVIKQPAGK